MKKFLIGVFCLFSVFCVVAEEYFYVENFEIIQGQELVQVPVKAHLDYYVSAWQVDFTLPEGISIFRVDKGEDLTLVQTTQEGEQVTYEPTFATGHNNTRVIIISMEQEYYEGNRVGVVKWGPGDYEDMLRITLKFLPSFTGGDVIVTTVPACGVDTRPGVIPTSDGLNKKVCTITVREDSKITTLEAINEKAISEIRYYNLVGQEMNEPKGVTIIFTTYEDGTVNVSKIVSP